MKPFHKLFVGERAVDAKYRQDPGLGSVTRSSEIDSAASLEVAGFDQRARGTEKRSPWRSHLALIERPFFDQDRARSCPKLSLFSVHSLSTSPNEPTIHGTLRWKQSRPATLFVLAGQLLIAQSMRMRRAVSGRRPVISETETRSCLRP